MILGILLVFTTIVMIYLGGRIDLSFLEKEAKKYWSKKGLVISSPFPRASV